jgi:hypothetical protein
MEGLDTKLNPFELNPFAEARLKAEVCKALSDPEKRKNLNIYLCQM